MMLIHSGSATVKCKRFTICNHIFYYDNFFSFLPSGSYTHFYSPTQFYSLHFLFLWGKHLVVSQLIVQE